MTICRELLKSQQGMAIGELVHTVRFVALHGLKADCHPIQREYITLFQFLAFWKLTDGWTGQQSNRCNTLGPKADSLDGYRSR